MKASLNKAEPVRSSRDPTSTTTLSKSWRATAMQLVDLASLVRLELGKLAGSGQHGDAGAVLDEQLVEECRIQAVGVLQGR